MSEDERVVIGSEEEDLLQRSVKKAKESSITNTTIDEEMLEKNEHSTEKKERPSLSIETSNRGRCNSMGRRMVSHKDIVLQLNGDDDGRNSDDEDWITTLRREEEEDDPIEEEVPTRQENPLCSVYHFSKKQHQEDRKKWRKALIIKLLGKKISNRFLMTGLLKIWCLTGRFEVIDLGNGYILVNFHEEKDYFHVLHEGPWIMVEHYVVVQRWRPMFDPHEEKFKWLAVWLCIPGLPLEFYTTQNLWRIGNMFGKTLKVDQNSLWKFDGGEGEYTEKAKYAKICVEVNLRRSFISQFQILDKLLHVAYEGLHFICFGCGRYGNR